MSTQPTWDAATIIAAITHKLDELTPGYLDIQDDSMQHHGHAGAHSGGHFTLTLVSPHFIGQSRLARQRKVSQLLAPLMGNGIHALVIKAYTPDEFAPQAVNG